MKRLVLFASLLMMVTIVSAQKSIDDLFAKYAGKDGFTTVTINGNLLKMLASDENDKDMPASVTEIRILAQDDENMKVDNFYEMVIKDIDLKAYEEFMSVKDKDENVKMLVKAEGKKFKEFLFITGGKDNAIIQIKGDMSFDDAKKLSANASLGGGFNLFSDHKKNAF